LIRNFESVRACSVNPIDVKVRGGVYDDYPDYYERVPRPYQIIGFDGAGTIQDVGPDVTGFSPVSCSVSSKGISVLPGCDLGGGEILTATDSTKHPPLAMTDSLPLLLIQRPPWAIQGNANEKWQGDDVFYSGSPIRHGSNAEFQLVDARSVAKKPQILDFVEAAAMPLTYVTAYEALVERMEIKRGEQAALLIINGAGGLSTSLFLLRETPAVPFHSI
jgi:NADPH:quinone reductase-like Zn-dependent oxidoreductase